ncbi:MAG: trypsin-like peptidase domain-containing protein [Prolixibacteraceae bacterium]|jgi:Do/DeqQ family serine protease|nr:trypsin-like peptidase domain-containing protein [Prolixibacteraceae bacterium]MDI9563174.1 trypsin-like peptidase domain-containing protein [Bacteroidota bacterium]NLT00418.1 PDZ domain-containing protein [Bacteroidales bacterium]OQB81177.1 MAG: putative periplasmic serine endoprotease DegP-like precursor [Bacteroidetes bacterium ADurb.Bin123]HNZ68513.1 trypsin-like peptidase domain-containing protein [Prolixibacteraceae bacterium]
MKNVKKTAWTFVMVLAAAFLAVFVYSRFFEKTKIVTVKETPAVRYAGFSGEDGGVPDLTFAAENTVNSVVHIMTQSVRGGWSSGNPWLDFFGYRQEPQIAQGFGSGVIISSDGFIVTNNHVIEGTQKIKVILNDKREFAARLIGADATSDLAVLKIDEKNLPFLKYGNAENLKIGEWVLAVGNPFNLTSTVTAGIVSAKARNLNISGDRSSIESFIQTDAAVNPGNSGGALVNQRGELVGINTLIASRTGSYAGYSFAIPTTIVHKVVDDLKKYGEVQRALLGVEIIGVDAAVAEKYKLNKIEGVYVDNVMEGGAAKEAGMKPGDVILSIQEKKVNSNAELQEVVSQFRPGDQVKIVVKRNDSEKLFTVKLRNKLGETEIVQDSQIVFGAEFETVTDRDKSQLNINRGIRIKKLSNGKIKQAGIPEGFVITDVNKKPVYEVSDFKRVIANARGGILVEGVYPNGELAYFVFGVN